MLIQHIATTLGQPCGIALFAEKLTTALRNAGAEVKCGSSLIPDNSADVILLEHEWAILSKDAVRRFRRACQVPIILIPHAADGTELADCVDGFITLNDSVLSPTKRPVLQLSHPSFVPERLQNRNDLKQELGLTNASVVIGTSGFLMEHRHFGAAVARLMPTALENNWLISITTSDHRSTPDWMRQELTAYAEAYPDHFRYTNRLMPDDELNRYWQACDLLWCWTILPDRASYASGVAADMYGSGTRLVVAEKAQHAAVLSLPNVVRATPDIDGMMRTVVDQAKSGDFPRHDPHPAGWPTAAHRILEYLGPRIEERRALHVLSLRRPSMKCGILKDAAEIELAARFVEANRWTHHADSVKDWDLAHVLSFVKSGNVLDMGCCGSYVLPNLMGCVECARLVGTDLRPCDSAEGIEYITGDLTNTGLPECSFDAITCLSVVEHGVDFAAFAREVARLLRPKGHLFVTFDYWEPRIVTGWGDAWEILDRNRAEALLKSCNQAGLDLVGDMDWSTGERPIQYQGQNYTFGMFTFCRR